jgi:hypothetical protein
MVGHPEGDQAHSLVHGLLLLMETDVNVGLPT